MDDNILIQLNSEQIDAVISGLNLLRRDIHNDMSGRVSPRLEENISKIDNLIYYLKCRKLTYFDNY
jgi:hypothetical protein